MIKTNNINKFYDKGTKNENHVVNNVNIELPDTGLVCILGESGSGKTTLLNCIGKLDTFNNGELEISGKSYSGSVGRAAEQVRNERFAYVFQNYFLIREQTVYENLMLALNLYDIPHEEKVERIDYVLDALDIKRFKKRKVSMLSGGQQQRVAIARAIIKSPEVIFADEPTGNLDEENTVRVMNILKRISKNCLVLLATHEKRIAEFYADRIINVYDGKIVKDFQPEAQDSLMRFDDHDIYLDEYKKENLDSSLFSVDFYSRGSEKIRISIVQEGGNLYITAPDSLRIERIGSDSSVQIKEGSRPKYDRQAAEKQQFSLTKPRARNGSTLSFGRIFSMALNGIASRGGKLAIPIIAMLLTAILCMFAVTDYLTIAELDPTDFITADQRVIDVVVERYGFEGSDEPPAEDALTESTQVFTNAVRSIIESLDASGIDYILFPTINSNTSFTVEGFYQINEISETVRNFSYVPLDYIDESYLIMGRMPENCNEVVVDRWVLDKFLEKKTPTAQAMLSIENFLDRRLHLASRKGRDVTIVGISDTGAPAIYVDYAMGISLCRLGNDATSLEMLAAAYPGLVDEGISTEDTGMAYISDRAENFGMLIRPNIPTMHPTVVGYFPGEYPADFAVNRATFHEWSICLAEDLKSFTIYTYEKEAIKEVLNEGLEENVANIIQLKITDKYTSSMALYRYSRNVKLYTRVLVIGAILGISFVVLYVAMRGAAVQRLREIAVYRLLGIKKRSIISLFAVQILLMSLISTLIGALATAGILHLLSEVKTMNYDFNVTWASVLLTLAGLFIVNLVTGTLPIARLINIPPAQLSAKYDL